MKWLTQDEAMRQLVGMVRPGMRCLMPTGSTPLPFYAALRQAEPILPLYVCHLDEWLHAGLPFFRYMNRELPLFTALKSPRLGKQWHTDIDLAIVGIGHNGHIAFNEPGVSPDSRLRAVKVEDETWRRADTPSPYAITVGIADILDAYRVVLIADERKRAILNRALLSPISSTCPASYLRLHPRFSVVAWERNREHCRTSHGISPSGLPLDG